MIEFQSSYKFEWNGDFWIKELNLVPNDRDVENVVTNLKKKIEIQMITTPSSDKYYYRYKNGMKWQGFSSKEGYAPKINFGTLLNSIGWKKISQSRYEFYVDAPYAAALELGTPKMAPRPFFEKNVKIAFKRYIESVKNKFRNKKISKTSTKTYGEKYGF